MPELPEVETIVRGLNNRALNILGARFLGVWTDFKKLIKKPNNFEKFKKDLKGKKIEKVWRRGKNIIFDLKGGISLLVHQKLTGHLLCGKWKKAKGQWRSIERGPLDDPMNRFLHLIFYLDNGKQLALSDLRKFAKIELWETDEFKESREFKSLGPEPLEKYFTFEKFKKVLSKKGKIKQVLMDQNVIVGIGNIYADEILFEAKIHPEKDVLKILEKDLKKIYLTTKNILKKAIKARGTSTSDFRDLEGKKGLFGKSLRVYRKTGQKCPRCSATIRRIKIGGRSAHFCPACQILGD
ncbi:MAG: DNA-formamidopyrimidine glycosylase [Patescibacteria group bacterium]